MQTTNIFKSVRTIFIVIYVNICVQGLSKYSDIFLRHEIDLKMFSYLTEDELKEIGINAFGKLHEKDKI